MVVSWRANTRDFRNQFSTGVVSFPLAADFDKKCVGLWITSEGSSKKKKFSFGRLQRKVGRQDFIWLNP